MAYSKGHIPWNKNKKNCFIKQSLTKMSIKKKGIKLSKEECAKPNHFHKGYIPWNKGKYHTTAVREKISIGHLGSKNGNWKGGISSLGEGIRGLRESVIWKIAVFKKDNSICQECGHSKNKNLEAHHIYSFHKILSNFINKYNQFSPIEDKETMVRLAITYKPFWNINNGRTLCKECHKKYNQLTEVS